MIGWRCSACGWETFDLEVMHSQVNWPESDGTITLVCPSCGTEGRFVDAETKALAYIVDLARAHQESRLALALRALAAKVDAPLRRRPDDWPLCPLCGEDELYSLDYRQETVTGEYDTELVLLIHGCYRCGWMPRTVGPLADGSQHWEGGDGAPAHLVQTTLYKPRHSPGHSTQMGWWP